MVDDAVGVLEAPRSRSKGGSATASETAHGELRKDEVTDPEASLRELEKIHRWDPNMPAEVLEETHQAMEKGDTSQEMDLVEALVYNVPYPEVQAAVRNYDEDLPVDTIRAWVLGLVLTTVASGFNTLFSLRSPAIAISALTVLLVAYPLGAAWHKVVPDVKFRLFGKSIRLNPGPFNFKEHTIIVLMANVNVAGGTTLSTDIVLTQRVFYGQNLGWGFALLLIWTTQLLGFGLGGLARKFLVYPVSMIWPANLVNTSLLYTLHDPPRSEPKSTNGWRISRYKYFGFVFLGSFLWYWFPGYIAPFLSAFVFVCWIKPDNVIINQLFGAWTGISLIPITFDWTQISAYAQSPLVPPFYAIANTIIGVLLFFWAVAPAVHFTGIWYGAYLPIGGASTYDNTGLAYNVTRVLTSQLDFDVQAYQEYSPMFISTIFAVGYGLSFAAIPAIIVHTVLFNGRDLWHKLRNLRSKEEDIHTALMKKYRDVPYWWYTILFVICLGMSFGCVLGYNTGMTWWAFVVAMIVVIVLFVPIGLIQGATSIQLGLNVFFEYLIGYLQPGHPNAMMLFKAYGYVVGAQGLRFTQDLKLGHYMKIPQRSMFWAQVVATFWASIVQIAVLTWALDGGIPDVCSATQSDRFTCPYGQVFFSSSIIWGVIGPQRMFSTGNIYASLQWFWLLGALLPMAIYAASRMFPKSNIKYLSAPLIFGGAAYIPPAGPFNYLTWGVIGFVFNKYIRNRYRGWWMRYNYLTSAGLDVGLAISTIVMILTLNLTKSSFPKWWGTTAPTSTMDYLGTAVQKSLPEGGIYGPKSW